MLIEYSLGVDVLTRSSIGSVSCTTGIVVASGVVFFLVVEVVDVLVVVVIVVVEVDEALLDLVLVVTDDLLVDTVSFLVEIFEVDGIVEVLVVVVSSSAKIDSKSTSRNMGVVVCENVEVDSVVVVDIWVVVSTSVGSLCEKRIK